ncbi:MAG: GDP-mannose 4,6-dehydratase, partial [Anaerovoracaceae bacterium]
TRDFNYVKDTAEGFLAISKEERCIGEEINIATQKEISVGELAEEMIRQINPKAKIICEEERLRPEKSEVNRLLGSNKKIMELTDWEPKYNLSQGLAETIEFLKANMDKYKPEIYNI